MGANLKFFLKFYFAYFFETNTHITLLYVENDQIWNILQKFTLEGCGKLQICDKCSTFPTQITAIFQSKIVEKVLILKLYNLAYFILALWPLRLLRAFLEKWCVSIKSVCYFNSALLWWFEVCTVEINYQSQSRQSHGSCYRLRNWTVKNIHYLHFMLIRITEKVRIIQSFKLTVISTWTAGYAWQLENSFESHYWPVSQPIYM